ncbi:hypothetical protein AURDEDRAFT_58391 [Auricularia subglabra TFB-10046 SS5]|nr:hypothetical protein AURDEDRAFT_58391 [Auricularia subglabra TFB-10046 SS5]
MLFSVLLTAALATAARAFGDEFVVNCDPLTIQRSVPIISKGVPSGHVHAVIGGNAFQRDMNAPDAALASNATTCDKKLDHSNYWVPMLCHQNEDGRFEMVKWRGTAVYYLNRACNYSATERDCDRNKVALAFPMGFRMIAGDSNRRYHNDSDASHNAVSYMCMNDNESHEVHGFPVSGCKTTRAQVFFPSCWDGVNLDSPDHKSHVAYPTEYYNHFNGGVCPKSHPVALLSIFFEYFFDTSMYGPNDPFAESRLVFANGDATGHGFHGDFINGWKDLDALQHAHETCLGPGNCPIETLGSTPDQPPRRGPAPLQVPAVFEEDIGLDGAIIDKLPGNNPVTTAPCVLSVPQLWQRAE